MSIPGSPVARSKIDRTTGVDAIIEFEHNEIHAGDHFFFTDSNELSSTNSVQYLLTTPDTTSWAHLFFQINGTAVTSFTVHEAGDRVGSVAQTIFNNNRNSAKTATMTVHKGITGGTTDGTLLWQYASGTATNQSQQEALTRAENELILKQDTKYLITILSGTDGNLTNIKLNFYEHINL